ncbi:MAG TPA: hypothetical protein ACFYD6_00160 [Candidatus Brocadiia bacterium]|nr:hypothetical protein [Candidatus Brocadiales bacterium]
MPSDDKNELEKVQEEHCERVFERYEAKSKSFQKLFSGLVGFSLIFSFFVLFPYVSIQSRNYRLPKQVEDLQAKIGQLEKSAAPYKNAQDGIKKLQKEIKDAPNNLREYIESLPTNPEERLSTSRESFQESNAPNAPIDLCNSLKDEDWVNCKVKQEVERYLAKYHQILNNEVVKPLRTLNVDPIDPTALNYQLLELETSFKNRLDKNPRFWKTWEGKGEFSVQLEEDVHNFWNKYDTIIGADSEKLKSELEILQKKMKVLEEEQERIEEQQEEITDRLNSIESPLGKFPVGLNESVLVFPIVLAIWFLFCTSFFCEAIRLRKVFHDLYQKKDPEKTILTDSQVTLVAPLWIDPANLKQNKTLKLMVLLTPFVFFVVAIGMISYIRTISYDFAGTGQLNYWVYVGLYVLSSGLFIYGYWQIKTELRRYTSG